MQTETLDKLYLEWSQFTKARTAREIKLQARIVMLVEVIGDFIVDADNGLGPSVTRLSDALVKIQREVTP